MSHLSCWIPRDRTETSALPFHFWGRSCWLHPHRIPPTPHRRLIGGRSPGSLVTSPHPTPIQYHLLPISWAGMQDKSILGWEWQGLQ